MPIAGISPRRRISGITAPLMLIHGESDRLIPSAHLDMLFSSANKANTQRLLIPHCGHSDIALDPVCVRSAIAFLRESLSSNGSGRKRSIHTESTVWERSQADEDFSREPIGNRVVFD